MDTKFRSLAKAVLWRVIATIVTWFVAYLFTKTITESLLIALVAGVLNIVAYYLHERGWNMVTWGRQ